MIPKLKTCCTSRISLILIFVFFSWNAIQAQKDVKAHHDVCLERGETVSHTKEAKRSGITLEFVHSPDEVMPGSCLILSILTRNDTSHKVEGLTSISLPKGWKAVTRTTRQSLIPAKDTCTCIYAIQVPPSAYAQEYKIVVQYSPNFSNGSISTQKQIKVLPVNRFHGELVKKPLYIAIGDLCNMELVVKNLGNTTVPFFVTVRSDQGSEVEIDRATGVLLPTQVAAIRSKIDTGQRKGSESSDIIFFKVYHAETGETLFETSTKVDLLPKGVFAYDPYMRIPAYFRSFAVGQDGKAVAGVESSCKGHIGREDGPLVDVFLRYPSDSRNWIYAEYQRFFVHAADPDWNFVLGDAPYSLTCLTERRRYGRGIELASYSGPWSLGALYVGNQHKTVWNQREFGAYLSYSPCEGIVYSSNFFHKNLNKVPSANIISLEAVWNCCPPNIHTVEIAHNTTSPYHSRESFGFHVESRGRVGLDSWYSFEQVYAGMGFYGYYNHLNLVSKSFSFPLNLYTRGNISYLYSRQSLYDTESPSQILQSPRQKQLNVLVSYNDPNGYFLNTSTLIYRAKNKKSECPYDFLQSWGGFTCGFSRPTYSLFCSATFGSQKDFFKAASGNFLQKYMAYCTWAPRPDLSWNFLLESGNTDFFDVLHWVNSVGINLKWNFGSNSWVEGIIRASRNNPRGDIQDQAAIRFSHLFYNNHLFRMNIHYFRNTTVVHANKYLFLVDYTIPFGLPVGRKWDEGTVSGYLYDHDTGIPIEDAIVELCGEKHLTDYCGKFAFFGVSPGNHVLSTNLLPKQMVHAENDSIPVKVRGGRSQSIHIPITRTCKIHGKVIKYLCEEVFQGKGDPLLKEEGPLPGVRIIIERDDTEEVLSVLSDKNGKFVLDGLRPGKWRVYVEHKEANCRAEAVPREVELGPQSEVSISIRVTPLYMRTIKPFHAKKEITKL